MSTTTDPHAWQRRKWPLAIYCALALTGWFGSLTVAALALEPTRVIVIAPWTNVAIASAAAANVDLLDASAPFVTVSGRSQGFVRRLYAAGAWLVLPAMTGGCRTPAKLRSA